MSSIVDMHAHYVSPTLIREAELRGKAFGSAVEVSADGRQQIRFQDGTLLRPFFRELCDLEVRLPEMDERGIGSQIVSTWTDMAGDNLPIEEAARWARLQNETLAADVQPWSDRFIGMGTLPMNDAARAIDELEFIVKHLGMNSVEIGTNINGRDLDHPEFRPLWRRICDLGVFVLLHPPMRPVGLDRTGDYFLNNLISYPVDTTIAAARLLFSGIFQELPGLKICLAHSGGFLPFQIGRMDRGYHAHPACSKSLREPPSKIMNNFIFDSLTHNDAALAFLLELVGPARVVYGSDYPFEMLDPRGTDRIKSLDALSEDQRSDILGGNISSLLMKS